MISTRLSEAAILGGDYSAREVAAIAGVLHYHPRHVRSVLKNGGCSYIFAERLMMATGAPLELFLHRRDLYRQIKTARDVSGRASASTPLPSTPLRSVTEHDTVDCSSETPIQTRARRYRKPSDWIPVVMTGGEAGQ